jgi:hypothetical protein
MSPTPDLEVVTRDLQSVDTPVTRAKGESVNISRAALILILAESSIPATSGLDDGGSHVRSLDCAAANDGWIVDVGRVSVELKVIPVLHNIDLALGRPWVAIHPTELA